MDDSDRTLLAHRVALVEPLSADMLLDLPERRHGLYRARGEGRTLIDMKLEEFPADMTPATRGYDGVSGVLGLGEPIVGGIAIRL